MQKVLTACPHPAFSAGTCRKMDGSALGHHALVREAELHSLFCSTCSCTNLNSVPTKCG